MRATSPEEARALFNRPLRCVDYGEWETWQSQGDTVILQAGVLDHRGASAQMIVELMYTRRPKTGIVSYRFTVFKRNPWGNEPAYQLHVSQSVRGLNDAHSRPHEHMGTERTVGDPSWAEWSYDDALAHFCARTGINFDPPPPHPDHFELRGQ